MAIVFTDNKHYQDIANKIRELAPAHYWDPNYQDNYYMTPEQMVNEGIQNVYWQGELSGESYGYSWGKNDVISNHEFKTVTGKEFRLTDFSEIDFDSSLEITANNLKPGEEMNIMVCGSSLGDIYNKTFVNNYEYKLPVSLPPGTYTLSGEFSSAGTIKIVGYTVDFLYNAFDHTFTPPSSGRYSYTFTTLERFTSIAFYSNTSATIKNFHINKGNKELSFDEYGGYSNSYLVSSEYPTFSAPPIFPETNIFFNTEVFPDVDLTITYRQSKGVKTEYDRFWDSHPTAKGKCTGTNLFSGAGWNDETFKPKYDIIIGSDAYMMFKDCAVSDLVARLREANVSMRFENTTSFYYTFYNSKITHIGEIPLTANTFVNSGTQTTGLCYTCSKLEKIDKVIVNNEGTTVINDNAFYGCKALKSIRFEGVIGQNLNLGACPLDTKSILNIVEHLSDTATGKTLTLKQSAVNMAWFDLVEPYYQTWDEVAATKPNWTFNLV